MKRHCFSATPGYSLVLQMQMNTFFLCHSNITTEDSIANKFYVQPKINSIEAKQHSCQHVCLVWQQNCPFVIVLSARIGTDLISVIPYWYQSRCLRYRCWISFTAPAYFCIEVNLWLHTIEVLHTPAENWLKRCSVYSAAVTNVMICISAYVYRTDCLEKCSAD